MRLVIFCLCFICSLSAYSQALPSYVGGAYGGTLYPGSMSDVGSAYRTIAANTGVPGETLIADRVRASVGAANADLYVNRAVSARSAAFLGTRLIPLVGTAALAYTVYNALGCSYSGGQFNCDIGGSQYLYSSYVNADLRGKNPDDPIRLTVGAAGTLKTWSCPTIPKDFAVDCTYSWIRKTDGITFNNTKITIILAKFTTGICIPGAAMLLGNVCPTGVTEPLTSDQAADKLAPLLTPAQATQLVADALGAKIDISPYALPRTASGPVSVVQPSKVETTITPNGTQSVTTTNTTTNITYAGDTVTYNNTTVVNNPDGSSKTTKDTPQRTECEINPSSVGCMPVGDLPTDKPTWQTKQVDFQAENLGLSAGCPAPWVANIRGWSLSMSYQPACDVAPQIRAGVLALASLGALLLIITTTQRS